MTEQQQQQQQLALKPKNPHTVMSGLSSTDFGKYNWGRSPCFHDLLSPNKVARVYYGMHHISTPEPACPENELVHYILAHVSEQYMYMPPGHQDFDPLYIQRFLNAKEKHIASSEYDDEYFDKLFKAYKKGSELMYSCRQDFAESLCKPLKATQNMSNEELLDMINKYQSLEGDALQKEVPDCLKPAESYTRSLTQLVVFSFCNAFMRVYISRFLNEFGGQNVHRGSSTFYKVGEALTHDVSKKGWTKCIAEFSREMFSNLLKMTDEGLEREMLKKNQKQQEENDENAPPLMKCCTLKDLFINLTIFCLDLIMRPETTAVILKANKSYAEQGQDLNKQLNEQMETDTNASENNDNTSSENNNNNNNNASNNAKPEICINDPMKWFMSTQALADYELLQKNPDKIAEFEERKINIQTERVNLYNQYYHQIFNLLNSFTD